MVFALPASTPASIDQGRGVNTEPIIAPFRARARILALLGDQLIGSDQLAVFELVKNAYDADASKVSVELQRLGTDDPLIEVVDDGDGMDAATIVGIWLEPASDHREVQRLEKRRTPLFNRLPLGEKGVGRFAVHKLGHRIELTTRPRGSDVELCVELDWDRLIAVRYLDETRVEVVTRAPVYFTAEQGRRSHGTRIVISRLRKRDWRRGEVRQLNRSITAISSPFSSSADFKAELKVPEHPDWLDGMPDVPAIIGMAPWSFSFSFDGQLDFDYAFRSPLVRRIGGRELARRREPLLLERPAGTRVSPVANAADLAGIGTLKGNIVAYDRDRKLLNLLPQTTLVKQFLDQQGGIRVYRDGVRIYNYGEPSDDWLQLDLRRVNRPTQRLSRNIVVGAINLDLEQSIGLREKTNREGFDETDTFKRFRSVVTAILHRFEVERALDKDRLKRVVEDASDAVPILVETPLHRLREAIGTSADAPRLLPLVDRVQNEFREMRDLLLRAGMSGLNLAVVIHEVEKGVGSLYELARGRAAPELLEAQARNLVSLIESVGGLLRQGDDGGITVKELVRTTAEINVRRYQRHQIHVTYALPEPENATRLTGSPALLQNVLVNLLDNAIYWLRVRWPDQPDEARRSRRIHVSTTEDLAGGMALVVADNGPGFQDVPEIVTKPFFTRRPEGKGLGLYYASLAMTLAGGTLLFPETGDVEVPVWADGAVVAMQFSGPAA